MNTCVTWNYISFCCRNCALRMNNMWWLSAYLIKPERKLGLNSFVPHRFSIDKIKESCYDIMDSYLAHANLEWKTSSCPRGISITWVMNKWNRAEIWVTMSSFVSPTVGWKSIDKSCFFSFFFKFFCWWHGYANSLFAHICLRISITCTCQQCYRIPQK